MERYWVPRESIYDEEDHSGKPRDVEVVLAADARAAVEALQKDVNTLNQLLRDKGLGQGEIDGMAADIDEIATLRQQVEALQRERDGLEAKCLEEHVTIEQADSKVMKLEGEKGMWANERIDLLTQLENAESQLSQLQALVRALVCTMGYVVDGSYILTRGGVVLYACSSAISAERLGAVLAYRATLPATPTERGQG